MAKQKRLIFRSILLALSMSLTIPTIASAAPSTSDITNQIKQQTGITVRYKNVPENNKVMFQPLKDETAEQESLSILKEVLSLYPSDINQFIKISYIDIVDGLVNTSDESELDGKAQMEDNSMYDSWFATHLFLRYPTNHATHSVYHHELFHAIEFSFPVNEKKWAKIAAPDRYGFERSDYTKGSDEYYYLSHRDGFFSTYSYTSEYEDRAEVYASLLYPTDTSPTKRAIIANDVTLKKKADFIMGYMDAVFSDHKDSDRLLTALDNGYNYFFAHRYFAANEIHRVSKKGTVHTGYKQDGTAVTLQTNDLLYILETMQNPKNTYLALDKEGNLLYVPTDLTEAIQKPDILPLMDALKKQSISLGYSSKHAQITGKSILNENSSIPGAKTRLLYVTLNNIQAWLNTQTKPNISRIVFLENMTYNRKSIAVKRIDSTLYIDIYRASNQDIVNALTK